MPTTRFGRRVSIIMPILSVAVAAAFLLAVYSVYETQRQTCDSRNKALNVLHDIVVIATKPDPAHHISRQQQLRVYEVRKAMFARIDNARC